MHLRAPIELDVWYLDVGSSQIILAYQLFLGELILL